MGHIGQHAGGTIYRGKRRAVETERLSLLELCKGNSEGGSFTGAPKEYVKERSRNGHLCIEAALEDHEGRVPLLGTLKS